MTEKKDLIVRVLAGITVAILLALAFFFVHTNKQAVLFVSDPWPPYVIGQVGSRPTGGPAVQLLGDIFKRLEIPMDIRLLEWKDVMQEIKRGNADAVIGISKNPERMEYLSFSRPFLENRPYIYYQIERFDGPFEWHTMEDLRDLRIGLLQGVDYGTVFNLAIREYDLDVSYASTSSENNARLLRGDIDLFIAVREIEDALLKRDSSLRGLIAMSERPLTEGKHYHIAFSKKSPYVGLLPEIDALLDTMERDGTLRLIMTSYTDFSVDTSIK